MLASNATIKKWKEKIAIRDTQGKMLFLSEKNPLSYDKNLQKVLKSNTTSR